MCNYRAHAITKLAKQLLSIPAELLASQQRGLNAQVCTDLSVHFWSLPFTPTQCHNEKLARTTT